MADPGRARRVLIRVVLVVGAAVGVHALLLAQNPRWCFTGSYFQPGCGTGGTAIAPGCYEPCTMNGNTCGSGECQLANVDPCASVSGSNPAGCSSCGSRRYLCIGP